MVDEKFFDYLLKRALHEAKEKGGVW